MSALVVTGYDHLAAAAAGRVDAICDRFEAAWQVGQRPTVESHLADGADVDGNVLLRELILLDIAYRRRIGETPLATEYSARFPHLDKDWLTAAVAFSADEGFTTVPEGRRSTGGTPVVAGYEVIRELGRGGMGVVYEARDIRLNRPVALKFLSADAARDPRRLDRFRREARAACALNHPAVCTLYNVGDCRGVPFLILEYVEGRTLRKVIEERPDLARTLQLVRQVAAALRVAHAVGIVHRDIKPENLMVRPDGYVKVLDFGLARLMTTPTSARMSDPAADTDPGTILGTASYMAPEQVRAEPAGGAADVFALGIVLYELVTGRHPFPGETEFSRMHAITSITPIAPTSLNPSLSAALDRLIRQMIEKDSRLRPTAAEVGVYLDEIAVAGGGLRAIPISPTAKRVVGRERERQALWQAFDDAAAGHGRMICVTGEPGIGKTTLVESVLEELASRHRPHCVARGRCSERLAGAEAYLPVLEALEGLLRGEAGEPASRALAAVAPAWHAQVVPSTHGRQPVADSSQERLKRELVAFVREVSGLRPLVLFLDDVHWADPSTVDLLAFLGSRCEGVNVLVVLTYRPTEMALSRHPILPLQLEWQRHAVGHEVALAFLSGDEVDSYLTATFPGHSFPAGFAQRIHARTEGSPLFVVDLLRYLSDSGAIARRSDGWVLTRTIADVESGLPESVRSMVQRKLGLLDDDDRRLLCVASVQGPEFDSAVVAEILGAEPADVEERLQILDRVHGLVRLIREQEFPDRTLALRYGFVHNLYQHALFAALPPSRRAQWSAAQAEALLEHHGDGNPAVAAEVACLFEAGRDLAQAARYFLVAAENAARVYAHLDAVELARRGLRLLARLPDTQDRVILELPLQMALGLQLQVTEGYAAPAAREAYVRARELCRRSGEVRHLFSVVWGLWLNAKVRSDLPTARTLAEELSTLADQLGDSSLMLQSHQAFAVTTLCLGEPAETTAHMERGIALYDPARHESHTALYGHDPGVACRAFGAVALWLLGFPERALRESGEAIRLSHELGQPSTQTLALHFGAMLAQCRREPRTVQVLAELGTAIAADQAFSFWHAGGTILTGWASAITGDATAVDRIRAGLDAWQATGSITYQSYYAALLAEALALHGRVDEARRQIDDVLIGPGHIPEGLYEAELYRLRGEFMLVSDASDPSIRSQARDSFRAALATARRQGALSLELRAATSLYRMDRDVSSLQSLADVFGRFTEGFDTPDLVDASELLNG